MLDFLVIVIIYLWSFRSIMNYSGTLFRFLNSMHADKKHVNWGIPHSHAICIQSGGSKFLFFTDFCSDFTKLDNFKRWKMQKLANPWKETVGNETKSWQNCQGHYGCLKWRKNGIGLGRAFSAWCACRITASDLTISQLEKLAQMWSDSSLQWLKRTCYHWHRTLYVDWTINYTKNAKQLP